MKVASLLLLVFFVTSCFANFENNEGQFSGLGFSGPCTPNSVFSRHGRECTCDSESVKRCENSEERLGRLKCEANGQVYDGCNWCDCDGNGKVNGCTLRGCYSAYKPCTAGTTYRTDGKDCACEESGQLICI